MSRRPPALPAWLAALALPALALATGAARAAAPARTEPVDIAADRLIGSRTPEGEVVLLEGNVVLRRGTTVVRSSQGQWAKTRRTVTLTGGVTAVDGTLRITAQQADYQEASDLILLSGDVHVTDEQLEASSSNGSYDAQARRAELWGGVRGVDHGRRLTAERVSYLRDTQVADAEGQVWAADSTGELVLTAAHVRFDRRAERARALGSPRLTRTERGRQTVLTGDTLTLDTAHRIAWADGHVHVARDTLEAQSEHAQYWDAEDRGVLTGSPVARNREVEATGDSIEVFTRDNEIERASVRGTGRIEFKSEAEESRGERNTLTAPRIEVYFAAGRVDSLHALGGAENLYQGAPVPGRIAETNRAHGDHIAVYFGEDRIDRATVTGRPSGEYRFELAAADSARAADETVRYDGGRIDYLVQERRIRIRDAAKLHYQTLELSAGRVDFDSRKQTLIARDHPALKEKDEEVSGRTMTYDLDQGRGTVFHAATQYDHGFYRGEAIERAGDDVLQVRGASYSTCDLAEPHYHVTAGRMKIILHDKIIARPLVFYIKNIPLLAFPFYILPIKSERHSGLLFPQTQIGFNSASGRFLRNLGYYWAPNDYMDLTLSGDYYEREPLWVLRGEGRYRYLDRVNGQFDVRYTASNAFLGQRQYDVTLSHNQTLDSRTRLTAQGNFTSSREFQRDDITGQPLADRTNRFLVSSVVLNRRLSFGALNAYLDRRQDLDAEPGVVALPKLTEDLPIVSLALFQHAIGHPAAGPHAAFLPWLSSTYYNLTMRGVSQHTVSSVVTADTSFTDSVPTITFGQRDVSTRLGVVAAQGGLSDNRRILGFLNVSPNFNFSTAFFSKDALGNSWTGAGVYNLGIGTSTTLYGTFHPNVAGVRGVRHILFPQVNYVYQPDFPGLTYKDANGFTQNRFPVVGGVSLGGARQSLLNYSLQQRIQMRLQVGDKKIDLPNLLTMTSGGSYDFLWRQHGLANPWRPLSTTFRLQPPRFFSFNGSFTHSFDQKPYWRTFTFYADLRLSGSGSAPAVGELPLDNNEAQSRPDSYGAGPWNLSLTYSYTRGRNALGGWDVSQSANSYVTLSPTPKWHLTYYNTVNLDRHRIEAQEYSVERDLHCWQARFVRRFTADSASEYFFRIAIVQQPEVNIGLGSRGLGTYSGF